MLLLIDNYDSFTFNLAQYFGELGADVVVRRNDAISLAEIERLRPSQLVISPGPCTPNEAGISLQVIQQYAGKIPLLGVCLGHQAITQAFGGNVIRAPQVMHGKTSPIYHNEEGLFSGLPSPFVATRYHSLMVDAQTLPACLAVTAWTQADNGQRDLIMGLRHRQLPIVGVQFHPEAILTQHGHALLKNFLQF
jgi:anthranilate synthase component 2